MSSEPAAARIDEAEKAVEHSAIVLRPIRREPRQGWAEASRAIAADAGEGLAGPESTSESDKVLRW